MTTSGTRDGARVSRVRRSGRASGHGGRLRALALVGAVCAGAAIGCQGMSAWRTSGKADTEEKKAAYNLEELLKGNPTTFSEMLTEAKDLRDTAYAIEHYPTAKPAEAQRHKDDAAKAYARAVHWLQKAIALEPDKPEGYHALGNCLATQGNLTGATAAYQDAVKRDPKFAKSYYGMGVVAFRQAGLATDAGVRKAKYAEAARDWERTVALAPDFGSGHYNLGVIAHRDGHWKQAKEHYQRALKAQSGHANAKMNLGLILASREDNIPGAVTLWQEICNDRPRHVRAHYNLARAAIESKKYDVAEKHWQAASHGTPTDVSEQALCAEACYRLAILYEDVLHQPEKCRDAIYRACEMEPLNTDYRQFLRRVERRMMMQGK